MDNTSNLDMILENTDMIDVMEGYIDLQRKTDEQYVALCPFHEDKNPSFSVNPVKGVYHCFGCGASGNLITFLEKINHEDFMQSVNRLSKISGIKFNTRELSEDEKRLKKRHEIINDLQDLLQHSLFSKKFKNILEIVKSRGLTDEEIKKSGIGFCDQSTLVKYFNANDIPLDLQMQTKLVELKNNTAYYPLENRITFPIKNLNGQIIGFSGGRTQNDVQPKYKHSIHLDEGPGFFYQNLNDNQKITIVEGFYDQISLSVSGIKNVVATLGTSAGASKEKVRPLLERTNDFVICMDGDLPGLQSSVKMARLLKTENQFKDTKVSLVMIPEDLDPDDYRKKYGKDELLKIYQKNQFNEIQLRSKIILNQKDKYSKEDLIKNVIKNLRYADDPLQRELFVSDIAKTFGLSEDAINEYYDKNDKTEDSIDVESMFDEIDDVVSTVAPIGNEPEDISIKIKEQAVISYLMKHPEEHNDFEDSELVLHHDFAINSLKIIERYIDKYHKLDVHNLLKRLKNNFAVEQMFIENATKLDVSKDEYEEIIDELSDDDTRREELLKDLQEGTSSEKLNLDDYLQRLRESGDLK